VEAKKGRPGWTQKPKKGKKNGQQKKGKGTPFAGNKTANEKKNETPTKGKGKGGNCEGGGVGFAQVRKKAKPERRLLKRKPQSIGRRGKLRAVTEEARGQRNGECRLGGCVRKEKKTQKSKTRKKDAKNTTDNQYSAEINQGERKGKGINNGGKNRGGGVLGWYPVEGGGRGLLLSHENGCR